VQLYVSHEGIPGAPLRALKGFQRIRLDPGAQRNVSFTLSGRDLSIVDSAGKHRIAPGKVGVWIGSGQPLTRGGATPAGVKGEFTISGEGMLPD